MAGKGSVLQLWALCSDNGTCEVKPNDSHYGSSFSHLWDASCALTLVSSLFRQWSICYLTCEYFLFFLLGPHRIFRLGVEVELQLWPTPQPHQHQIRATFAAYTTAHGNARSFNPLSEARDLTRIFMDTRWSLNLLNANLWIFLTGTISEWSCSGGKSHTVFGWSDSAPGMGEDGLSHLVTFIMCVIQDHAFELRGDMSTRPQKQASRGDLCLNVSISMTSKLPNSPAELPPKPQGSELRSSLGCSFSSMWCGQTWRLLLFLSFSPSYLTVAHLPSLVEPFRPCLGFWLVTFVSMLMTKGNSGVQLHIPHHAKTSGLVLSMWNAKVYS